LIDNSIVMTTQLYINLLKKCLLDDIYANQKQLFQDGQVDTESQVTRDAVVNGLYWPDRAHSMIGYKRMDNLQMCVETCLKENITGDFIETGVWRGGACIFMKGILEAYQDITRKVYVADSFEGLPPPDPKYQVDQDDIHHSLKFLCVDEDTVRDNFQRYDLLDNRVVFIKGFFEHSLDQVDTQSLAILRLDGDMYSSTIQVLEQLYDKVSPGGFIIIDDWCLIGARTATENFREQRGITTPITIIDDCGAYWRKE